MFCFFDCYEHDEGPEEGDCQPAAVAVEKLELIV